MLMPFSIRDLLCDYVCECRPIKMRVCVYVGLYAWWVLERWRVHVVTYLYVHKVCICAFHFFLMMRWNVQDCLLSNGKPEYQESEGERERERVGGSKKGRERERKRNSERKEGRKPIMIDWSILKQNTRGSWRVERTKGRRWNSSFLADVSLLLLRTTRASGFH